MREKLHLFCAAAAAVLAIGTAQASQQAFTRVTPSTVNHSTALRSALKQAPVTHVLAQWQVAKGVVVRAVKDAQGRIYKQVVRNGVPSPAPGGSPSIAFSNAVDCGYSTPAVSVGRSIVCALVR